MSTNLKDKSMKVSALSNLTSPQLDIILQKVQLRAPDGYDVKQKLLLLRCNQVFAQQLGKYEDKDIFATFNKANKFIDFRSMNSSGEVAVDGIFSKEGKCQYPCSICSGEVTDEKDDTGNGLHCGGCEAYFHMSCCEYKITSQLFDLVNTGEMRNCNYVKVYCPNCVSSIREVKTQIADMKDEIRKLTNTVTTLTKQVQEKRTKDSSYSSIVTNGTQNLQLPAKVLNTLARIDEKSNIEEKKEKLARTRYIRQPKDKNITKSEHIRREFNKHYEGLLMRQGRTTVGGGILMEFEDAETAVKVSKDWKDTFFGGNSGLKIPGEGNRVGVIKHVYNDMSEEELTAEIKDKFPGATCEFFKRPKTEEFTGIIKVEFADEQTLERAIKEKVFFRRQCFQVEEYKRRIQVIKCHRCQKFGHIARTCRSDKPKCGKCCRTNHETRDCTNTTNFMCAHCDQKHITGSATCPEWMKKVEEVKSRNNYGY